MKKDAGILMPILSLPNQYGCGDFGKEAYAFIDKVADIGFSTWQILPLQPLGYGASPYQPYSSKAMDELYISLDVLKVPSPFNTVLIGYFPGFKFMFRLAIPSLFVSL